MSKAQKYRILIGGGGTGGHVFPAISIANALKEQLPNAEFLFVGAQGRLEMEKVPQSGYKIVGLPVAGFQRRLTWKNFTFFVKLIRSMIIAQGVIKKFRPQVAIGVGGYASGPVLRAAARKKIPVILQEQNSYAGVTNRLLAKHAQKICVAFDGMEKYFPVDKILFTGNPVRQDLLLPEEAGAKSYANFGIQPNDQVVLLCGGSGGAGSLNDCIMDALERIGKSDYKLIWQCGKHYYDSAREALASSGVKNVLLHPFISEMNRAYQVADLIISRAGAGTISELCIVGKPVILVPSPNVAENHQMKNARSLGDKNAAEIVADDEIKIRLVDRVENILNDKEKRGMLSENIRKLAIPDSADRIADEVIKVLEQ
ncbi:MAG TPA: undecaprenyldiphospho-muramoylpentapeptide beta-N-acetylglucosaminyltransferase [Bacteroidales bacterium]|nr:undecaprenyldiphospho-muramoylpentapeptide beta-N-acetylglucosaminyltransferase [Bacteroidales bacterium]